MDNQTFYTDEELLARVKKVMAKCYPSYEHYVIKKSEKYFIVVPPDENSYAEPIIFENQHAFPLLRNFSEIEPDQEFKTIEEV